MQLSLAKSMKEFTRVVIERLSEYFKSLSILLY